MGRKNCTAPSGPNRFGCAVLWVDTHGYSSSATPWRSAKDSAGALNPTHDARVLPSTVFGFGAFEAVGDHGHGAQPGSGGVEDGVSNGGRDGDDGGYRLFITKRINSPPPVTKASYSSGFMVF